MNPILRLGGRILDGFGMQPESALRQRINEALTRFRNPAPKFVPFTSYSQFGEDAFVAHLFADGPGTYVDVGAGHPIRGSNTYAFYQRGWSGMTIDPIRANISLARRIRPRDHVLQHACGETTESVTFYEFDIYEYSTTDVNRMQELTDRLGIRLRCTYDVTVVPMSALGIAASPEENSLLSIDVEGTELSVLKSNDWNRYRPRVIIVEEWDPPAGKRSMTLDYLENRGYRLEGVLGLSSVYRYGDL